MDVSFFGEIMTVMAVLVGVVDTVAKVGVVGVGVAAGVNAVKAGVVIDFVVVFEFSLLDKIMEKE